MIGTFLAWVPWYVSYAYLAFCGVCGLRGFFKGLDVWWKWYNRRAEKSLPTPTLEPVYNLCIDTVHLAFWCVTSTASSFFVAFFFPVTLPLLSLAAKEKKS